MDIQKSASSIQCETLTNQGNLLDVHDGNISMSSSINFNEVPIMDSLKNLIDKDDNISISDVSEYTPMMDIQYSSRKNRLNRFVRVQLEPLSNKTYNFYSRYKNSKGNISSQSSEMDIVSRSMPNKSTKQTSIDYSESKKYINYKIKVKPSLPDAASKVDSIETNQSHHVVIQVHDEDDLRPYKITKTEERNNKHFTNFPVHYKKICIHSFSLPGNFTNKQNTVFHKHNKSMPNLNLSFNLPTKRYKCQKGGLSPSNQIPPTAVTTFTDRRGTDQQARRNSFRRKLHNLKKYADESMTIECSNSIPITQQQSTQDQSNDADQHNLTAAHDSSHRRNSDSDKISKFDPTTKSLPELKESPFITAVATMPISTTTTTVSHIASLTSTSSQELSRELWQLRALLANNIEDMDSEESIPATPYNLETISSTLAAVTATTSEDSPFHPLFTSSCNSSLLESFQSIEETLNFESLQNLSINFDKNEFAIKLLSRGINDINSLKLCKELIAKFASTNSKRSSELPTNHIAEETVNVETESTKQETAKDQPTTATAPSETEDLGLHREPSVRRQTYRNAIARRQAKQDRLQQQAQMKAEQENEKREAGGNTQKLNLPVGSETSQDTESSVSFERYLATGGSCSTTAASLSFEDSNTSTDSTGECHSHKLEKLRGDSGYKSLETQQSLNVRHDCRTMISYVPQESNIISEDETVMSPIVTCASGSIPVLTRRVHSADENLVRTDSSIIPSIELIVPSNPQSSMTVNESSTKLSLFNKMSQQALLSRNKAAEKKRIQYKCDRQLVQIQDSFIEPGLKGVKATTSLSHFHPPKPPFYSSGSITSSSASSFASSFFSRFLKSHSRRTLVRMQRDYSIDERTDALFNEFLRFDPALEIKHTLCVTSRSSPRTRHRVHYTNRHRSTEQPQSGSPSRHSSYLATNEPATEMRVKRHDRRQQRFSTTDKIADINFSSKYLELQSYKRFQQSFNTVSEGNSNNSNHEIGEIAKNNSHTQEGDYKNDVNKESKETPPKATSETSPFSDASIQPLGDDRSLEKQTERSSKQMETQRTIPVIQLTEEE